MQMSKGENESSMRAKSFKIGKVVIPYWLVAVLLASTIGLAVFAQYLTTVSVPLQVKQPLGIISYPSGWSLYPGQTANFNITVMNYSPLNYSVVLDYQVSNLTYQTDYLTFSSPTYTVVPGQQNLEAWLQVAANAPAANVTVTISLLRVAIATPHAAITCVLGPTLGTWSSGNSFDVILSSAPTRGDVLICTFGDNNGFAFDPIVSIANVGGNVTWTKQVGNAYNDGVSGYYYDSEIWYGVVNSASSSRNITITLASGVNGTFTEGTYAAEAFVSEYSGMATSGFLDRTASNQGVSTESDSGTTATTTQANELCIASIVASAPQNNPTNGFTLTHYTAGIACDLANFNETLSTTGIVDTGAHIGTIMNGFLHDYDGCIATFFAS